MNTFAVCALGCRVNQYDAEAMREELTKLGFAEVDFEDFADVYLVATCTVTGTSDKKSRQMISRAHRRNPDALIVAAGCLAQRDGEKLLGLPGVGLVIGSKDRKIAGELVQNALREGEKKSAVVELTQDFEELNIGQMRGRTRVDLKIQEGCDNRCAYCIIPSVRGPIRSRPLADALAEAKRLAENGVPEIILTGIHLTSYGRDLQRLEYPGELLAELIEGIESIDGVRRIRIGSLEPQVLTRQFMERINRLEKPARQLHVALQSGSEGVLRRMGRSYTADGYKRRIALLREYWEDAAISTDVLTGFPGETEDEEQETLGFVREIAFSHLHVFPFSPREGTRAAVMPDQLTNREKQLRAGRLIALGEELKRDYYKKFDGQVRDVLFEGSSDGASFGRTGEDIEVEAVGEFPTDKLIRCRLDIDGISAKAAPISD